MEKLITEKQIEANEIRALTDHEVEAVTGGAYLSYAMLGIGGTPGTAAGAAAAYYLLKS